MFRPYLDMFISRSEQAPGSVSHPRGESGKIDYDYLWPFWCDMKVKPEIQVPCGPYKLLVSYEAHQMKEKIRFQK